MTLLILFFGAIGILIFALVIFLLVWVNSKFINWIFRPLAIPESFVPEFKRERLLMRLALFGESFGYFGLAILGSTYIIGWIQDQKMRKAAHASGQTLRFGIVPQFTLADLFTLI